jgi:hypothetical protein
MGSQRSRAATIIIGSGLAALGLSLLTWWLLRRGTRGVEIVSVLGLPLTTMGTLAALYGLFISRRREISDSTSLSKHAWTLLGRVITKETGTLQQMLNDTGIPKPASVGFGQPETAGLHWRTDGGASYGSLATIAWYYTTLQLGRLVILGNAGAGKTVLVVKLLLDLAEKIQTTKDASGDGNSPRIRIPVRFNLSGITMPSTRPRNDLVGLFDSEISNTMTRDDFDNWTIGRLTAEYALNPEVARSLVGDGWVLPILDGLDEMDLDQGHPSRARALLSALNSPTSRERWPVVLTCRTKHYDELSHRDSSGLNSALQDATVVVMQPLEIEQIANWLASHFPDRSQPDGIQARWRSVLEQVSAHPTGQLATCLRSPLRLSLAVTIYKHPQGTPRELCEIDPSNLDEHLFSRLVPTVSANHSRPNGNRYEGHDVERWLHTLADHLARMGGLGQSGVNLHIEDLWLTAGHARRGLRYVILAILTAVGGFLTLLACIDVATNPEIQLGSARRFAILFLRVCMAAGITISFSTYKRKRFVSRPASPNLDPPRTLGELFDFAEVLGGGAVGGLVIGLIGGGLDFGLIDRFLIWTGLPGRVPPEVGVLVGHAGVPLALGAGVSFMFAVVVAEWFRDAVHTTTKPSGIMRQNILYESALHLSCAIAGIIGGIAIGLGPWGGLSMAFWISFAANESTWTMYILVAGSFWRNGRLPLRLGRFLDWAHSAGLLRLSGTEIQFRHLEVQARLTSGRRDLN